ncbi:PREDICTED: uncharacterized protein LOC106113411 isoform X2 [Papilio xuthus]|uniref:Uncharacterized protein LOC106113411 isoform X2 n=1 Tax=Papilio xuthus TaxID=66420 RepID=A0AAJ7E3X2_PAPXU|nr:PREDICTED: uncharacterized protein LOC106113411 isoform X2 [Papilio xuthus]
MRRTYRSKKDDGSIDHKKLISRIDGRSSAFDAFYIHNIKLNKKEISSSACSNQINLPSKKIRKRKYVKRIVNDGSQRKLPHPGEPESQSVLLTPDKSIHVNKAPDQFDLLLRSSPTFTKSPILVHKLSESLNINRKTKYNCSVDCADWDNVNAIKVKSSCSNTSDVKSHKLIVEVEDTSECKCHDESIRRIVKHMPLLNNINNPHLKSIKNNHRLTATQQNSPAAANSPLCSTPFQLKHRCQSIFNISPISINFKDSPKVVMNTFKASSSDDEYENKSQCETSVKIQSLRVTNVINCEGNQAASKDLTIVQQKSLSLESEILHTLSTSEVEPCYGFAKPSEPDYNTDIVHIPFYLKNQSNDIFVSKKSPDRSMSELKNMQIEQFESEVSWCAKECLLSDSSLLNEKLNTIEQCTSKNSSCITSETNLLNDNHFSFKPNLVVALEKMDDSLFRKYYKKYKSSETIRHQFKVCNDHTNFDLKDNLVISSASYNTDCGNNFEVNENQIELSNASYNTDCGYNLEEKDTLNELSNNSYNTDCGNNFEVNENQIELSNASYNTDCGYNFYSMDSLSPENCYQGCKQTLETNKSPKQDAGISYVTTRRRHEANNSVIILPDTSFGSCSVKQDLSAIVDNIHELAKNEKSYVASEEYVESGIVPTSNESVTDNIISKHEDILLRDEVPDWSNVTCEQDSRKLTKCDIVSGPKVAIVLQPGKKWERSLSIYKRMTTIADTKHSLLDYEETESKGRKYRQSVIDTMQMQKSICSLHNEPINGRRSTFICKPSRSTIKLVKENGNSRASLCPTTAYEDLKGFLSDDCDDTIVDLSKLSIGESVHEVTVVENLHEASRIATARDYVLRRCNQTEPLLFDECYPDTALKNCHKIGEGVYGEVFLWRARDGEARVLKVIPIAGDIKVNGEPQKGYDEIISEIVIAMELSALRAPIPDIEKRLDEGKELDSLDLLSVENATDIFNEVLAVRCVRGAYPARLLELWELYDECHGSDNDNPGALPTHQHYLVLELRNAGRDLESYSFTGADQAYAVLLQVSARPLPPPPHHTTQRARAEGERISSASCK